MMHLMQGFKANIVRVIALAMRIWYLLAFSSESLEKIQTSDAGT